MFETQQILQNEGIKSASQFNKFRQCKVEMINRVIKMSKTNNS